MKGFFAGSEITGAAPSLSTIPKCGACGLKDKCLSPKMPPSGKGRRRILLIGEAPGETEDHRGVQFVGKTGILLRDTLGKMGVNLDRDCRVTNAIICRPPNNETPTDDQLEYCRPNLVKTVQEFDADVIIPLGNPASKSLLQYATGEPHGIGLTYGLQIPSQRLNAWVCPTYHPSYIARSDGVAGVLWERHLKAAVQLEGKPWDTVPDFERDVTVELDDAKAAKALRWMIKQGGTVAFDYETNRLKPDFDGARIVSCSVCWEGKRTIAYPWHGDAIEATRELLRSPLRKIASNMKFEDRWSRKILNTPVNRWWWDTMLMAHVIHNRPSFCSVKFQALVWLGQEKWNQHIEDHLSASDERGFNRIQEIELTDLLVYNGLDSLLEYHVAMKQVEFFKSK
jgi:uracil-DNA glycosylase family 4